MMCIVIDCLWHTLPVSCTPRGNPVGQPSVQRSNKRHRRDRLSSSPTDRQTTLTRGC